MNKEYRSTLDPRTVSLQDEWMVWIDSPIGLEARDWDRLVLLPNQFIHLLQYLRDAFEAGAQAGRRMGIEECTQALNAAHEKPLPPWPGTIIAARNRATQSVTSPAAMRAEGE